MSNSARILILLSGLLMVSCYKPYTADIDNNETVLVVDGLISNKSARYHIKLRYSSGFYSSLKAKGVAGAKVSVTDDAGTRIDFRETKNGDYVSDSTKFTGSPGKSYILRIETQDSDVFESSPQKMEMEFKPDSVYSVVDYQNYISRYNQLLKKVVGASVLADIDGKTFPLPEFRFDVKMIKYYMYSLNIPPPNIYPPLYLFYCWQSDNFIKDIIISDHKRLGLNSVEKQFIEFVDNSTSLMGIVYDLGQRQQDQSYIGIPTSHRTQYVLSGRIMYIDLYSLNDDAFRYYQKIQDQLSSEGKLFDPISAQIGGNIKCVSDPDRKVFGFFEVSALNKSAYKVGIRIPGTNQFPVIKIPYVPLPSFSGCIINKKPPFWIN